VHGAAAGAAALARRGWLKQRQEQQAHF